MSGNGTTIPAGTFFVPKKTTTAATVEKLAADLGTPFVGTRTKPRAAVLLKRPRVALWDRYGGSMPSGWTRWIFEQFEFPFAVVYPPELDKGGLREKYDVIVLVDGAYASGGVTGPGDPKEEPAAESMEQSKDDPYRDRRGSITPAKTLPQLRTFLEAGGTILTIGSSTRLGRDLGLPVANHLVELDEDEKERPFASSKYYVPSSVLRVKVDPSHPLAWGLENQADVMFSMSPTFRLTSGAAAKGVRKVAWFDTKSPLRSGWAWGQEYLEGGAAVVDARVGDGRLAMFGPQVLFRGQSHGTFKFVFNGIVQSVVKEVVVTEGREQAPKPRAKVNK